MPALNPIRLAGRRPRKLLPLLILVIAGGVWIWGVQQNRALDQAIAVTIKDAARAACGSSTMPADLHWPLATLKSTFREAVQEHCGAIREDEGALSAHVLRAEQTGQDVGETHIASVSINGMPVIDLQLHAISAEEITVLGWSLP